MGSRGRRWFGRRGADEAASTRLPFDEIGPAMRIALRHRGAAVAYARAVTGVRRIGGSEAARWYADIVLTAADADGDLAATLARSLPEHLVRAGEGRALYGRIVRRVLRERPAAAPLVARTTPDLLAEMDEPALAAFVSRALGLWEESPARAESFLRRESDAGQKHARALIRGLALEDVRRLLVLYARAHCGEDVDIVSLGAGERGYAEARKLHLPARVADYGDERDFLVYRVMTAQTAGYLEFGTFELEEGIDHLLGGFQHRFIARDLFQVLEDRRVEQRVREMYPGVARDLDRLRADPARPRPDVRTLSKPDQVVEALARHTWGQPLPEGLDPEVRRKVEALLPLADEITRPPARVQDVAKGLRRFYDAAAGFLRGPDDPKKPKPPEQGPKAGRGEGRDRSPGEVRLPEPKEREYRGLELPTGSGRILPERPPEAKRGPDIDDDRSDPGAPAPADGKAPKGKGAIASYEEMEAWLDKRVDPGGGLVETSARLAAEAKPKEPQPEREAERGTFPYPEWDWVIEDYKPGWVQVIEHEVEPAGAAYVEKVRAEHGPLIRRLRRSFEAMRPEHAQRVRGLVDGEELDVDAAVEAKVLRRARAPGQERVYTRRRPVLRDVVAAFLVDLSSSTNEVVDTKGKRIIEVEKEALVCISEALDALGDRFAIYGFSGYGREHVAFYTAKDFAEPLSDTVRSRVGGLRWKMENRDGAAIRHATKKLLGQAGRQRLLFLLSDGRPLDCGCDRYFDRYAQQDTRQALLEARKAGVHPFCLTVDPRGEDYLEGMYGRGAFTIVESVESLPVRLTTLYRRLTR